MSDNIDIVVSAVEFDANSLKFMEAKTTKQMGKSITVLNSKINRSIYLSTPMMNTWGISDFVDKNTGVGNGRYTMSLTFPNAGYGNAETDAFLKNMIDFEKRIKTEAKARSKEWFGKASISDDAMDEKWNPMLKYPKVKDSDEYDYTRAPSLQLKVPYWEGSWNGVDVYDMEGNQLFPNAENPDVNPSNLIQSGSSVACLIQCGGIYIINGKIGVTWKLKQVVCKPKTAFSLTGKCFIKVPQQQSQSVEESVFTKSEVPVEKPVAVAKPAAAVEKPAVAVESVTHVEDTDDEEEKPVVEAPVAAPKKKVIVKKKV